MINKNLKDLPLDDRVSIWRNLLSKYQGTVQQNITQTQI